MSSSSGPISEPTWFRFFTRLGYTDERKAEANDNWFHIIANEKHLLSEWKRDWYDRVTFWNLIMLNKGPVRNIPFKSILENEF